MKKLLLLIAVAALSVTATAQSRAVLGVRAGMNISDMTMKYGNISVDLNSHVGYNVGISYQVPLVSKLFLETGLNLSTRGAKINEDSPLFDAEGIGKVKFNMLYLQLPVAFSWHFDVSSISLQPYVGCYYNYGIHGKIKADGEKENLFKETEIEGETVPQLFRRSDVGLRIGVGVAFRQKYYVGVGYDLGMLNLVKDKEEMGEGKIKNGNLFVTVGYNF